MSIGVSSGVLIRALFGVMKICFFFCFFPCLFRFMEGFVSLFVLLYCTIIVCVET